jgi:hypothetical protein
VAGHDDLVQGLPLAVDERLQQPVRFLAEEALSEHADAQIDRFC